MKHKRDDPMCDPRHSQGNEKMQFISIAFCLDFWSEMKIYLPRNAKQKNRLK